MSLPDVRVRKAARSRVVRRGSEEEEEEVSIGEKRYICRIRERQRQRKLRKMKEKSRCRDR